MNEITQDNFEQEVLQSTMPVLVDFYADWCAPCKALKPTMQNLEAEYEGKAKIVMANLDDNQDLSVAFNIASIPLVVIFNKGEEHGRILGLRSKSDYADIIDSILGEEDGT